MLAQTTAPGSKELNSVEPCLRNLQSLQMQALDAQQAALQVQHEVVGVRHQGHHEAVGAPRCPAQALRTVNITRLWVIVRPLADGLLTASRQGFKPR